MKSLRLICMPLAGLALMAMLSGCGDTASPTGPTSSLDTTPPPAPANLAYAIDGTGAQVLTWSASVAPDVASYKVYLYSPSPDRDNSYVLVDDPNPNDNSFTLPAVTTATDAIYRVRAVDTSNNTSAFSAAAEVTIGPPSVGSGGSGTGTGGNGSVGSDGGSDRIINPESAKPSKN